VDLKGVDPLLWRNLSKMLVYSKTVDDIKETFGLTFVVNYEVWMYICMYVCVCVMCVCVCVCHLLMYTHTHDLSHSLCLSLGQYFGKIKEIELKKGGASIYVTNKNVYEYVRLYVHYLLVDSIAHQVRVCVCVYVCVYLSLYLCIY